MSWNIAEAKQQFSEVVRLSAEEPQTIYNRSTPVAALVSAQEFERFQAWKASQVKPDLMAQFAGLRQALAESGQSDLVDVGRQHLGRANAFLEMLEADAKKVSANKGHNPRASGRV